MHTLKLITRFYRGIFFVNLVITLICVGLIAIYRERAFEILWVLFWFKAGTIAAMFFSSIYYRPQELYYYQNLGISKLKLGLTTSAFDLALFGLIIYLTVMAI